MKSARNIELPDWLKPCQKAPSKATVFVHTLIKGGVEWGEEAGAPVKATTTTTSKSSVAEAAPDQLAPYLRRHPGQRRQNRGRRIHNQPDELSGTRHHDAENDRLGSAEGRQSRRSRPAIGLKADAAQEAQLTCSNRPSRWPPERASDQPRRTSRPKLGAERAESQRRNPRSRRHGRLPEGMTLNPSAADGLKACTVAQARIHSEVFGSACPAGSEIGTVSLEVPTLPAGSLTGNMYLGGTVTGTRNRTHHGSSVHRSTSSPTQKDTASRCA